jgi:hypothetical protein
MNVRHATTGLRGIGFGAAAWLLLGACAWGGIVSPLYVGNLEPVKDQYGRTMLGSHLSAGVDSRSRLEIRTPTDGVIRPPALDGTAHANNPLLTTDSVGGVGMNSAEPNSGIFCMAFSKRPAAGTKIFARAFNAPTAAEASFYADSTMLSAPATGSSLVLVFGPAQPLDAGDADGDGLNNSWEKALGIDDRLTADYDGDGMSDLNEMYAGTAADDPNSLLAFRSIRREAGAVPSGQGGTVFKPVNVKWQSVPGKQYQLEFLPDLLGEQLYVPVGDVVTAGEGEYDLEMVVDVPAEATAGSFRVKLVTE